MPLGVLLMEACGRRLFCSGKDVRRTRIQLVLYLGTRWRRRSDAVKSQWSRGLWIELKAGGKVSRFVLLLQLCGLILKQIMAVLCDGALHRLVAFQQVNTNTCPDQTYW